MHFILAGVQMSYSHESKIHERRDTFTVYTCSYHTGTSNDGDSWGV